MVSGSFAVSPGGYVFQLADPGLAAQFTASGTKILKDDTLN